MQMKKVKKQSQSYSFLIVVTRSIRKHEFTSDIPCFDFPSGGLYGWDKAHGTQTRINLIFQDNQYLAGACFTNGFLLAIQIR